MTVIDSTQKPEEYDEETLNHIKKVLLEVLEDFITICDENNIEYFCAAGTTLGAIRHQGFIPWDDDIDVSMFREEYEKFYEVIKNYKYKYEILNIYDNDGFYRLIAKLNLKHTKNGEPWDINTDFTLGLGLDIGILDNLPKNKIKRFIFIKKVLLLKRLNLLLLAMRIDHFYSKTSEKIGHFLKIIFKAIGINQELVKRLHTKLISYPKGVEVGDLHSAYTFMPYPIEIFSPPVKVKFESLIVNVPNDWDTYLRITYGEDYMELPPKEKQVNHAFEVDFGPY